MTGQSWEIIDKQAIYHDNTKDKLDNDIIDTDKHIKLEEKILKHKLTPDFG